MVFAQPVKINLLLPKRVEKFYTNFMFLSFLVLSVFMKNVLFSNKDCGSVFLRLSADPHSASSHLVH